MRFAICNELFEGWDVGRVSRFIKEVGYDGIELAPFTLAASPGELTAARRAEIRRQAGDAGVEIIGLHWLLARTQGLHVTSSDPAVRRRTSEYLVSLAELCRDLGGSILVFGSPAQRSRLPGVSAEDAMTFAADTFQQALSRFEAVGATLCLEPLTHDETDFLNTCDEAVSLIDRIGSPALRLHLDVKAMSGEGVTIDALIRRFAPRAGHFHANDPNRRGPGFGAVDFVPIFRALREAGYNAWVSVEVFDFSPDPKTIARRSLEYMKRCWEA